MRIYGDGAGEVKGCFFESPPGLGTTVLVSGQLAILALVSSPQPEQSGEEVREGVSTAPTTGTC